MSKDERRLRAIKFYVLCLGLAIAILLLPLSKWGALIWTGGFVGGGSTFAIVNIIYMLGVD